MSVLENFKELVSLVRKLDNLDLLKRTLDLQNEVMNLTDENHTLKAEIAALKLAASQGQSLKFKSPFYFAPDDESPLCPRCWEVEKKQVHLHGPFRVTGLRWDCPNCKETFLVQTEEERNLGPVRRHPRFRR